MPDVFFAGQSASEYITLLNSLANGLYTFSAIKTGNFTAAKGTAYPISANGVTVTLPASATVGDRIRLFGTADSVVSLTLDRNGLNIDSAASNKTISGGATAVQVELWYVSVAVGWRVVTQYEAMSNTAEVKTAAFSAVAGKTYIINGSTFTVTLPTPAAGDVIRFIAAKNDKTAITFDPTASYKIRSGTNGTTWVNNGYDWDITFCYVDATIGWQVVITRGYLKTAPSISTNTLTLDLEGGLWPHRVFEVSLNANITTFTVNNYPASGMPWGFELSFTGDGTQRTVTWPTAWKPPSSIFPTPTLTNGKKDDYYIETWDGGTTCPFRVMGQNR